MAEPVPDSKLVTIDLGRVEQRAREAAAAHAAAVEERDRLLAVLQAKVDETAAQLAEAEAALAAVQQAALECGPFIRPAAAEGDDPVTARLAEAAMRLAAPDEGPATEPTVAIDLTVGEGPAPRHRRRRIQRIGSDLAGLTTRDAVRAVLEERAGEMLSLYTLHRELLARGFQGTHNEVHAAVSELMRSGVPVERVAKGHYRLAVDEPADTRQRHPA